VLRFTVPAGLIIAAATFSAYALARARGLPLTEQRTAATLVTLILSLCVLALLAMPLTWRRIALLIDRTGPGSRRGRHRARVRHLVGLGVTASGWALLVRRG
jgi:hypothetical protein